jgi:hydroxyacylglutathione hydrolase
VRVQSAAVQPFFKNAYLVSCTETREAVVIDPGDEIETLIDDAAAGGLHVAMILLTHAHLDHITGVGEAKRAFGAPIWLHRDDLFLYDGVVEQGRMFGIPVDPQPPVDHFYDLATALRFGTLQVDVRHTPGHCPGGVCLAIGPHSSAKRELFVGDTLFNGSIGRTDLPGGDADTLLRSIRQVLFAFPDDTIVHSGHGPDTTVGVEKRTNPFLS